MGGLYIWKLRGIAFEHGLRRFRDEAEQLRKFRNEPHIGVTGPTHYSESTAVKHAIHYMLPKHRARRQGVQRTVRIFGWR